MKTNKDQLKIKPRSIILLLGNFRPDFYDSLKKAGSPVYVLEGRPDFVSAQATCRELLKRGITPTVIADNTAGFLFGRGWVKEAWIAYQTSDDQELLADIGSLILGVLAKQHRVPLQAFPGVKKSRFVGSPDAVCQLSGRRTAPAGVKGYVPLIETLPKKYVRKIHV